MHFTKYSVFPSDFCVMLSRLPLLLLVRQLTERHENTKNSGIYSFYVHVSAMEGKVESRYFT